VETEKQQEYLTTLGCDTLQGYFMGHPMASEQFMAAVNALKAVQLKLQVPGAIGGPGLHIQH
jgi:EAL domain-containing protein (putative c-di-GMP-specific phosphodiesterase class I)